MADGSQYVTFRQALEQRPEWTERSLRRAVLERRVPFYQAKFRGKLLFKLEELDAYIGSNRVTPVHS